MVEWSSTMRVFIVSNPRRRRDGIWPCRLPSPQPPSRHSRSNSPALQAIVRNVRANKKGDDRAQRRGRLAFIVYAVPDHGGIRFKGFQTLAMIGRRDADRLTAMAARRFDFAIAGEHRAGAERIHRAHGIQRRISKLDPVFSLALGERIGPFDRAAFFIEHHHVAAAQRFECGFGLRLFEPRRFGDFGSARRTGQQRSELDSGSRDTGVHERRNRNPHPDGR